MVNFTSFLNSTVSALVAMQATNTTMKPAMTPAMTPSPMCISGNSTNYDCVTSFHASRYPCTSGDIDCVMSAKPTSACVSGNSTDVSCAMSHYHFCGSGGFNCMMSAYTMEYPVTTPPLTEAPKVESISQTTLTPKGTKVATVYFDPALPSTRESQSNSTSSVTSTSPTSPTSPTFSISPTTSTSQMTLTSHTEVSLQHTGPTHFSIDLPPLSTIGGKVAGGASTVNLHTVHHPTSLTKVVSSGHPPMPTQCKPGDQHCYAHHPPTAPPPPGPFIDPGDAIHNSPIDDRGKINGWDTPLVKLKHKQDNDRYSDRCYKALVYGQKFGDWKPDQCVMVINAGVTKNDPHGGRFWWSGKARAYADSHQRHPPCIDLRVDTGCGFHMIPQQWRCSKFDGKTEPYKKVDCSPFAAPSGLPDAGGEQ